ncbi:hypothetical protein L4528_31530, partial [Pseudomonas aeruginosa]
MARKRSIIYVEIIADNLAIRNRLEDRKLAQRLESEPLRTAESKHHFRISPFTTQQRPEGLVDGSALNASPEMTKAAS